LIRLAEQLAAGELPQRIAYIGDTVADVTTVINARTVRPDLPWQSLAVSPPHVENVTAYQLSLRRAGADRVLNRTLDLLALL
jgi:HAD superfamily phosphatase